MESKRKFQHQNSFNINSSDSTSKEEVESEAQFWVSLIDTTGNRTRLDDNSTKKRRSSKSYTTIDQSLYLDKGNEEDLNNVVEKFDLTTCQYRCSF